MEKVLSAVRVLGVATNTSVAGRVNSTSGEMTAGVNIAEDK